MDHRLRPGSGPNTDTNANTNDTSANDTITNDTSANDTNAHADAKRSAENAQVCVPDRGLPR